MSLYKLLGVARTASKQEIKVAYRKLALQFHPDKHGQSPPQARAAAAEKFRQLSSAYETLIDDQKRAAYDRNPDSAGEARRQKPKPRDSSSSNSAQSCYTYKDSGYGYGYGGGGGGGCGARYSYGGGGGARYPYGSQNRRSYPDRSNRMKAIRNYALQKLVKFGLEFSIWLLRETVRILIEAFIRILIEAIIEALKQKKKK